VAGEPHVHADGAQSGGEGALEHPARSTRVATDDDLVPLGAEDVAGGPPGTYAADSLFLYLLSVTSPTLAVTGHDATGLAGQWTFGNRLPVFFTGIDIFANLNHLIFLPLAMRGP